MFCGNLSIVGGGDNELMIVSRQMRISVEFPTEHLHTLDVEADASRCKYSARTAIPAGQIIGIKQAS